MLAKSPRRTIPALVAVVLAAAIFGTTAAEARIAAPAQPAVVSKPRITKILIFMVENHSLSEMKASMPYTFSLARKYAYATNYAAITHPSLPNYLAIAGGSTFGVTDDANPSAHRISGRSIFSQALAHGLTAKTYADSMPSRCALSSSGEYAVRHNPWAYFIDGRAACRTYDVPVTALAADSRAGRLPNVAMVIPNLVHDAHDGTLAASDTWIKARILQVMAGADWKSGHLAIVITADEDDHSQGNKVLTVVASRYQVHRVVPTALSHYSLTRLVGDVLGVPYLRSAATARSMKAAFGIVTKPRP
ncbi:MAG: phosphoesterase [Marmoricola sp.]|nr:phosphoesterase [Marmoricola sp.]